MTSRSLRGIRTIRFSDFEFDVRAGDLWRRGERVRLQEQPLRILTALLERPGEVVTREEICKRLWPNGTVVEVSHGINAAVQRLRESLGESAGNPRFVETLARRGYRFVAPTETGERSGSSPVQHEFAAPSRISHFRVLDRLGSGGMGVVYRAEDRTLGRAVALKFLPDDLARDPAALARFRREAQAASALNHPHICTIYGVEECQGKPVIVMEYIEGESLEAALRRGPLPPAEAVVLAIQMADALDAAHRAGIVHRDFKPANVLVTAAGVKVLDFGLAKMERPALGFETPHLTNEGAILGTLHYLSPEQAQGQPVQPRSDIFSLGGVLYEMLAGRRAFDGPNPARVMAAILAVEPAPLDAAISSGLRECVRRCLAKEPDGRWQSAGELRGALENIAAPRAPAPARRRWIAAAMLALLTAGAAFVPRHRAAERVPFAGAPAITAPAPMMPMLRPAPEPLATAPARKEDRAMSTTGLLPVGGGAVTRLAVSPDGKRLAYIAGGRLWVEGTNGEAPEMYGAAVGTPFWSPDGRSLAVTGPGSELLRFDLGKPEGVKICNVDTNFSGAWSKDGTIVIGLIHDGLYRVPAAGGALERITALNPTRAETRHIALQFLPDGRRFLYLAASNSPGATMLFAGALDSAERTPIMPVSTTAAYAAGYLVYASDSLLMARPFDWKSLKLSGEPIVVGQAPPTDAAANAAVKMARFSAAESVLALAPFQGQRDGIILLKNWARR